MIPDAGQLSQVMSQATAPAFVLGAVAGFVAVLLGRMTSVIDRIRSLNEIADDDTARAHLKSDIPRLRQRAKLLNSATTVRLKTWEIQLVIVVCNFETVGLARKCRLDLDLFKNRHRKDLQQCVETRLQP